MEDNSLKKIEDLENMLSILENRVNNYSNIIDILISGTDLQKQNAILMYKESTNIQEQKNQEIPHEKTYLFLKIILESMPFPVFIKDEKCKYFLINELEAKLFGLKESEVIGKDDRHFLTDEDELEQVRITDQEVLIGKKGIELPTQNFTLPNGTTHVFKTHKMPFINPISGKPNILGFSVDVSDTVNLNHLKKIMIMTSNPYL